MNPRGVSHKLFQEQARGQRPSPASVGDITQIGDFGNHLFAVRLRQRQRPHWLSRSIGRLLYLFTPVVVVTHKAGDFFTQGHHARSGESGQINNRVGPVIISPRKCVGQNQSPLRVGI